jgi:hypothetical protein
LPKIEVKGAHLEKGRGMASIGVPTPLDGPSNQPRKPWLAKPLGGGTELWPRSNRGGNTPAGRAG